MLQLGWLVSKLLGNHCMCWERNILEFKIDWNLLGDEGCNSIIFEVSGEDDGTDEHIDFIDSSWLHVVYLED